MKVKHIFPCPICDREDEVRRDRKGRPYYWCPVCHIRLFAPVDPGSSGLLRRARRVPI